MPGTIGSMALNVDVYTKYSDCTTVQFTQRGSFMEPACRLHLPTYAIKRSTNIQEQLNLVCNARFLGHSTYSKFTLTTAKSSFKSTLQWRSVAHAALAEQRLQYSTKALKV